METQQTLRNYIRSLLADHGHTDPVDDTESLILSGLLDSLVVVQIVVFMEQTFNIDFATVYFDQNDFDSINSMMSFIEANG